LDNADTARNIGEKTTMVRAARQLLSAITKVLILADRVVIKQLITAKDQVHKHTHTRTQTHPFNGPLSGTPQVSRYKKGKTNPDFTDTRDSEWQWHQLGHMQVCILLQTEITSPAPHHSDFYRPDALPAAQPTASKH